MRDNINTALRAVQGVIAGLTLLACIGYSRGDLPNLLLDILPAGPTYLASFITAPLYWMFGLAAYLMIGTVFIVVMGEVKKPRTTTTH